MSNTERQCRRDGPRRTPVGRGRPRRSPRAPSALRADHRRVGGSQDARTPRAADRRRGGEAEAEDPEQPPDPVAAFRSPRARASRDRARAHAARGRSRAIPSAAADGDRETGVEQVVRARSSGSRRSATGSVSDGEHAEHEGPRCALDCPSRLLVRATDGCRRDRAADRHRRRRSASARTGAPGTGRRPSSEYSGSRWARALEKPNRRQAAAAPNGRQFPKITAASAMNPRPAVMFSLNELTNPIERYAPPAAASMPERMTAP